jgi:hypothetical protein
VEPKFVSHSRQQVESCIFSCLRFCVWDRQSENAELNCDKQNQNLSIYIFFMEAYCLYLGVFSKHFNCVRVFQWFSICFCLSTMRVKHSDV